MSADNFVTPDTPSDERMDYAVRYPNGRVVEFAGRVVERIPCEMYDRKRREFFTGVKLVLEHADGRRLTAVGMRDTTAQEIPHV